LLSSSIFFCLSLSYCSAIFASPGAGALRLSASTC
jgi:hypothetical protein